ncbi:DUF3272 family protein [Streptococcus ovuberis]|uniref:DUF3272 family protein n=1 Tax=Streptococcus ovuberis TaxID=1936207 RepID=A0A7X6S1C6_9STRE|nr:DUF3272 family protein [Streptococcus ovuberis]NKZ20041.1 DUF3272 family protein [Streptococcus ovuberis]
MKIYLPFYQFIFLALSTGIATYLFNEALMAGRFGFAIFWGAILARNLRVSYQLSKWIRAIEAKLKN